MKFDGLLLFKKYIPLSESSYTEDLSTLLSTTCSPNFLCHFWDHKLFFTTQFLCVFPAQTLNTLSKSSPSKFKFSDFPLLALKFTKFLMSFFKQKVNFSSKFGPLFSVIRNNYPVRFSSNFICCYQKEPIKVQIFRLSTVLMKINQIFYVTFKTTSQFSFKYCITLQCYDT